MSKPIIVKSTGRQRFALYSGAMVETSRGDNTVTRHELQRAIKAAESQAPTHRYRYDYVSYINSSGKLVSGGAFRFRNNGRIDIGCKRFFKRESQIIIKWAMKAS